MKHKILQGICMVLILLVPFFTTVWLYHPTAHAQKKYSVWSTPEPKEIRVAIRENNWSGQPDPRGNILYVKAVNFQEYERDILPNEWLPSWNKESLQAGALAIKMFTWYHHLHPVTVSGFKFDVDNTVNFQLYRQQTGQPETDTAFEAIRNLAYVEKDGEIIELNYRAGKRNDPNYQYRNAQKMAQWGSQYWAEKGKSMLDILQFYYMNRLLVTLPGR